MILPETTPVFIYGLCHPITGELRYVGVSLNPQIRYNLHMSKSKNKTTHCASWIRSLKALGIKPDLFIIEESDEQNSAELERFWIGYLRFVGCRLTNMLDGGDHAGGHTKTPEVRKKMSEAAKKRGISPETRAKCIARNIGRKQTAEHIQKVILSRRDYIHSEETRLKISVSNTGKKRNDATKEKLCQSWEIRKTSTEWEAIREKMTFCPRLYSITSPEGETLIVNNLSAFCREHGLNQITAGRVARGLRTVYEGKFVTHYKGWIIKYADKPSD